MLLRPHVAVFPWPNIAIAQSPYRAPDPKPQNAFRSPKNTIFDPLENSPKVNQNVQKVQFWVQNGIFRTFNVLLGFRGSVGGLTTIWCIRGFVVGFEIALEPSNLQKEGERSAKGHFYLQCQTLVCTKPWLKRDLRTEKILVRRSCRQPFLGNIRWSQPPRFSRKHCDTYGRHIAMQWEEYWDANGRSTEVFQGDTILQVPLRTGGDKLRFDCVFDGNY